MWLCLPDPFAEAAARSSVAERLPGANCRSVSESGFLLDRGREATGELVVLALNLPDGDGLDLIAALTGQRRGVRLLVILDRWDEHSQSWLRRAAVHGIFDPRSDPVTRLPEVVAVVAGGGRFRSAEASRSPCLRRPRLAHLMTPREQFVFSVLGSGSNDVAAGATLNLKPETVHWYRRRIMRKLGIADRGALIRSALGFGVVRLAGDRVLHPGFARVSASQCGNPLACGGGSAS